MGGHSARVGKQRRSRNELIDFIDVRSNRNILPIARPGIDSRVWNSSVAPFRSCKVAIGLAGDASEAARGPDLS